LETVLAVEIWKRIVTMNKGKVLILSGPSGVGKGTVVNKLLETVDNVTLSISATTRKPRTGEIDGVHYFYISREDFEDKIKNDQLLEYNLYNGNYYGTLKSYVESLQAEGKHVILEIDVNGGRQIKEKTPDAITVFMTAPSDEEIERRLRNRNTETEEAILKRLEIAKKERQQAADYDFFVCNDTIESAVNQLIDILNK